MTIEEQILRAEELASRKNWISACVTYAELWINKKNNFTSKVTDIFNEMEIKDIGHKAKKDYNRFKHIVSIGDTWNDDEILLLMSLRIDLELLKNYFEFSNLEFPNLDLTALDESLAALRDSKLNKKDYYFALSLMDKNGPAISREILPR
jgi:hypothetical protein